MNWFARILFALALSASTALAHEGEDHAAPPPGLPGALAPRVEAHSDSFELVAILEAGKLTLYLDRFASNEAVTDAAIDIESGTFKSSAQPTGAGTYSVPAAGLTRPGQHPLVFTIRVSGETDLLNGTLAVPQPPQASAPHQGWSEWRLGIAAALVVLIGAGWLLRRRTASKTRVLTAIAAGVVLGLTDVVPAVYAHEGEDHSGDGKGASAVVQSAAGGTAVAQRLADGSVFMPKPGQRRLGLRTELAEIRALAQSIELNGRVVVDAGFGGRVQASQTGRIEPGPHGLPNIGRRVGKGEVLAYLRPVGSSIELGNQRAQLAELNSQHALAEKKLKRLEALEGSVPQKEIDAARAELASFAERKSAVGASLSSRETLIAPVAGVISAASAVAGQVVEAREILYEIVDPQRLMVEALAYDPMLLADIGPASALLPGDGALALVFVGGGQQLREQALPLLFRVKPPLPPLVVGQPLKVVAQTKRTIKGASVPLAALWRTASGDTVLWVHTGAERFEPRRVRHQSLDATRVAVTEGVAAGERVVTQGAAALAQVR